MHHALIEKEHTKMLTHRFGIDPMHRKILATKQQSNEAGAMSEDGANINATQTFRITVSFVRGQ